MSRITFVCFVLPFVAACSGDGGGGSGGFGSLPAPNPGSGSGLRVIAYATCITTTADTAHCPVSLSVMVEDADTEEEVTDATVEFGPHDAPLVLTTSGSPGTYVGNHVGLAGAYALDVTRGSDSLTGVILRSPRDFTMTLAPDPPQAGASATLRWTPSGEQDTYSLVYVLSATTGPTFQDPEPQPDNGQRALTDAFPDAGTYYVQLGRARTLFLSAPFSIGLVQTGQSRTVVAE